METAGILFAGQQQMGFAAAALLILAGSIFYPAWKRHYVKAGIISLLLLTVFTLSFWHTQKNRAEEAAILETLTDGETVTVQGKVEKIEYKNEKYRYYLKTNGRKVIVYYDTDEQEIGAELQITGQLSLYESAANEGQFDVAAYYRSQKIYFALFPEKTQVLSLSKFPLEDGLYRLRCRLEQALEDAGSGGRSLGLYFLTEERIGVLSSMLLGERGMMEDSIKDLYQAAGISHVLAISALHVSLIGMGFYSFLRKRRWGFAAAMTAAGPLVLAYTRMSGCSVSAQRAAIMILLTMAAAVLGRSRDMMNGLGLAAGWLLWQNPGLIYNSGFQFSLMAVIGIAVTGEVFSGDAEGRFLKQKNNFTMSLAISLTTLPLVAYYYYEIPLYSVFLNLLILPFMSILLISGVLGAFVGLFWQLGAAVLLIPAGVILWGYETLCSLFLKLPGSQVICGQPGIRKIVWYYLLLSVFLLILYRLKNQKRGAGDQAGEQKTGSHRTGNQVRGAEEKRKITEERRTAGIKTAMVLLCSLLILMPSKKGFELDQLDVGQGDGTFIRTEDGVTMMIDGGSTSEDQLADYCLLPFLKSKAVKKIDYWFISHGDEDHISGFLEVLDSGYSIGAIVLSAEMPEDEAKEEIAQAAAAAGVQILKMTAGDQIRTKTAVITCLYPGEGDGSLFDDRNDLSLTLLYEEGDFSAFFAGDLSSEAEKVLVKRGIPEQVDYLKVCHHGSKYSSCEAFLSHLSPKVTGISCALVNRYGHPSEEAVQRIEACGSCVFYTMYSGELMLKREKGQICLRTYR